MAGTYVPAAVYPDRVSLKYHALDLTTFRCSLSDNSQPTYFLFKFVGLVWMQHPRFRGALWLYATTIRPFLANNQGHIDEGLATIRHRVSVSVDNTHNAFMTKVPIASFWLAHFARIDAAVELYLITFHPKHVVPPLRCPKSRLSRHSCKNLRNSSPNQRR